jgi:uncharacterized protein (DUF1800 family)
MVSQQKKIQHLYLRAGFIFPPSEISRISGLEIKDAVGELFADSKVPVPLNSAGDNNGLEDYKKLKDASPDEKKEMRKRLIGEVKDLNLGWLDRMNTSKEMLREKMTLFWHGHFACHSKLPSFDQELNNVMRDNALGKFSDLLMAVSKSPAMLFYLNNQHNRKKSPNENFAREVMELFTMGRGNYTEDDVKNGARAFTGWRVNLEGEFEFKPEIHDDEAKTFLGETGNLNGEDVINIILDSHATAGFITKKIYRYFVNDNIDDEHCKYLADNFRTDYDIGRLIYNILTSDWFYDEKNIGKRIKSPVEFIVNLQRITPLELNDKLAPFYVERVLGQVLFAPPNVAGWPGGKDWIDSSSLMFRLSIPGFVYGTSEMYARPKESPDDAERRMMNTTQTDTMPAQSPKRMVAKADWTGFLNAFKDVKDEDLFDIISEYLIQTPIPYFNKETILKYVLKDTREEYIKTLAMNLMSTPEFQLC